jgi:hypothetical protein
MVNLLSRLTDECQSNSPRKANVVLYWCQARNGIIACEYSAKIFTVADAIRFNRTDTSLIRLVAGVKDGNTRDAADAAVSFVCSFFDSPS